MVIRHFSGQPVSMLGRHFSGGYLLLTSNLNVALCNLSLFPQKWLDRLLVSGRSDVGGDCPSLAGECQGGAEPVSVVVVIGCYSIPLNSSLVA